MICYLGRVVAVRNAAVCTGGLEISMFEHANGRIYVSRRKEGRSKRTEHHRSGQQKGTGPGAREVRGGPFSEHSSKVPTPETLRAGLDGGLISLDT